MLHHGEQMFRQKIILYLKLFSPKICIKSLNKHIEYDNSDFQTLHVFYIPFKDLSLCNKLKCSYPNIFST